MSGTVEGLERHQVGRPTNGFGDCFLSGAVKGEGLARRMLCLDPWWPLGGWSCPGRVRVLVRTHEVWLDGSVDLWGFWVEWLKEGEIFGWGLMCGLLGCKEHRAAFVTTVIIT